MKKLFLKIKNLTKRGFTLVELLVALTIFSFVVVMAIGALYSAQNYAAKAQESQIVLDGINFTMEVISREIRYGSDFWCEDPMGIANKTGKQDCDFNRSFLPDAVLYFKPVNSEYDTDRVVYYLESGVVKKTSFSGPTEEESTEIVTSPDDLIVESLNFYVIGSKGINVIPGNYQQPRVTIVLTGKTKPRGGANPTTFKVQNTITVRELDSI